jgi:hypothetical protein
MKIITVIVILFALGSLCAEGWNKTADVSMNLNQNSYSDNWTGEERGSVSWVANANLLAEKQLTAKLHNKNTLKLAFGQTHNQIDYLKADSTIARKWTKPVKTTDLIDFESMMRFTLGFVVDPFASVRWESQFFDSKEGKTKNLNPNILTETVGIARMFIKEENKELSGRVGAAFKQYFDQFEDESSNDGGIEIVGEYKSPFAQKAISYNSKLILYKALFYSESDAVEGTPMEDAWKAVRINWEHILSASITKIINLNLYFQMIYNEMQVDEIQFKQTLGVGFTFKLM